MARKPRAVTDAKKYLSSAWRLDRMVNVRIAGLDRLNALAESAEAGTLAELAALQEEISREIDEFVERREGVRRLIATVSDPDGRLVLEQRYLPGQSREAIAAALKYDLRWVYRLHSRALEEIRKAVGEKA